MKEIDFVLENYIVLGQYGKERIRNLFNVYKNNFIVIRDGKHIKGLAFYFKLTDETLQKIMNREIDLTIPENTNQCLLEQGNNIHFFLLAAQGYRVIIAGLRLIMNDAKSVSWFSPDMKQFFIRRILCHQS